MATTTTTSPSPPQSSSSPSFPFPREYFFPAFFTRQTNITIHHAQLTKWSALILAYARHHRLFRITISAAADSDLFFNRAIDRRLAPPDIREVLDFMRKDGRAEFLRPGASNGGAADASSSSASDAAGGDVVFLYWRKPAEWAALVEAFVEETAQKGSVLTVYELTEGENTRGTEFHGMDNQVLMKALNILVKRGKAQIFGSEDSLGVKFF
ncbi:ESCRT-II complex subunit domain-containing protein [Trichoderma sp. SZMC 28013]